MSDDLRMDMHLEVQVVTPRYRHKGLLPNKKQSGVIEREEGRDAGLLLNTPPRTRSIRRQRFFIEIWAFGASAVAQQV